MATKAPTPTAEQVLGILEKDLTEYIPRARALVRRGGKDGAGNFVCSVEEAELNLDAGLEDVVYWVVQLGKLAKR